MTGARGACGPHVVAELLARGYEITALTRDPTVTSERCTMVYGDLYGIGQVGAQLARCDGGIVHLATTRSDERRTVLTHDVLGTGELLDRWQHGPFVYAGSQAIYGTIRGSGTEAMTPSPRTWYAIGKLTSEFDVLNAAGVARRPGIVLRYPPLLWTARGGLLERLHLDAARGTTFVFDSEESLADAGTAYIGPRDYARAVVAALACGATNPYNVSSGFVRWRELLATLNARLGTAPKLVVRPDGPLRDDEVRLPADRIALDAGRFAAHTGFAPIDRWEEVLEAFSLLATSPPRDPAAS